MSTPLALSSTSSSLSSLLRLLVGLLLLGRVHGGQGEAGNEICDKEAGCETVLTSQVGDNAVPYHNLKSTVEAIRRECGEICDTSKSGKPGRVFDAVWKNFDCRKLFETKVFEKPSEFFRPPKRIPKYLTNDFSHSGKVPIDESLYLDDTKGVGRRRDWTVDMVKEYQKLFRAGTPKGPYFKEESFNLFRHLKDHVGVKGKSVLVIGSQSPWLESLILEAGANDTTSIDYQKMTSHHPQMTIMGPDEFADNFLAGTLKAFDVVVSFSSLEHSGLGRYGDGLNPWADLISMAKAWCVVKPEGLALIGVPAGQDKIQFNTHRLYGRVLYTQLFANWKPVYTEYMPNVVVHNCPHCYQPLFVLKKASSEADLLAK